MCVYLWIGEQANIIEKSKASEIYEWIRSRKDLGCTKPQTLYAIIDNKASSGVVEPTPTSSSYSGGSGR
jgi:hypothetical protein